MGVSTNRDEWVYDLSGDSLIQKIQFFIKNFNAQCDRLTTVKESELDDQLDYSIKWSDALKQRLLQKKKLKLNKDLVIKLLRRPFVAQLYYSEKGLSDRLTSNHFDMFGQTLTMQNIVIAINIGNKPFNVISSKYLVDLHFNGDSQCLPLYRYDEKGNRYDNITGWALSEFQEHYQDKTIGKEAIFHYVYGVLHHPAYRKKYETNLKREFPRIPFYDGFWKWSALGKQLMDMHLNFETAALYPIKRIDMKVKTNKLPITPKAKLKPDKAASIIELDNLTVIKGIPFAAWEYKLGNRSALEWLLEYYKERKPKDPTIFQKFNTYRFADNKDQVIDLLARVCTVSVETMKIIGEMGSISNDILPSN